MPLQNGTFDTDLSGWNLTPNWTLWQDGYARLNAAQAGPGAVLVQITNVPQASEVRLAFSAPMDWDSVERAIAIDPKPTEVYTSTSDTEYFVYFPLKPETDYRVTVAGTARDRYGVAIGQDAAVAFHTAPLPPSIALVGGYRVGAYNAYAPARVPIQHVGTPAVDYTLSRIDPAEAMPLISDYDAWNNFSPAASALLRRASQNLPGDRNARLPASEKQ